MDGNFNNQQPNIPEEYKPISMWGYFGYELLFSIPCIGLICLIVLALTANNKNVKNFARSYFCFYIIILILILFFIFVVGASLPALLRSL